MRRPTFMLLHNMPHNILDSLPEKLTELHWQHYNAKQKQPGCKNVRGQSGAAL